MHMTAKNHLTPMISGACCVFVAVIRKLGVFATIVALVAGCQTIAPTPPKAEIDPIEQALRLASEALQGGHADQALRELRPISRKNPDHPEVNSLMGIIQLSLKNTTRAQEHFTKAWQTKKNVGNGLNLASALIEGREYRSAEKILLSLIRTADEENYAWRERIWHNLGVIAVNTKRPKTAEKWFKKALEENPTFYLSLYHYGNLLQATKRTTAAMSQWRIASSACPVCSEPIEAMTTQLIAQGNFAEAQKLVSEFRKQENIPQGDIERARQIQSNIERLAQLRQSERKGRTAGIPATPRR
jgi:Tfp pilus assembly protein PilF